MEKLFTKSDAFTVAERKGYSQAIEDVEKMIDRIESVWVSDDILYDKCKGQTDVEIIGKEELKQSLKELGEE